ncbi:hypothetical protein [Morganella morganii]|uniref:hypothetical protein n=1 Tax=Morganella morganii TaxID=582 RepID=UPI003BB18728
MSVIITGGGMTGATLALALSRLSHGRLPVALAEARLPDDIIRDLMRGRLPWRTVPVSGWRKSGSGPR